MPVSPAEIAKFDALAAQWWDVDGPMRPLHRMNRLRVGWILGRLGGLSRIADIGCGAGIAAESLAAGGLDVLGVDASEAQIAAARAHAPAGAKLAYRVGLAEDLLAEGERFDAVTALEIIEHVPSPSGFVETLAELVRPGGTVVVSTINRTLRSLAVAKVGAEYVARLLPAGTHDWRQFVTPAELAGYARGAGLIPRAMAGMTYRPLGGWRESGDLSINYIAAFEKPGD